MSMYFVAYGASLTILSILTLTVYVMNQFSVFLDRFRCLRPLPGPKFRTDSCDYISDCPWCSHMASMMYDPVPRKHPYRGDM